jgi:hypothetical protein
VWPERRQSPDKRLSVQDKRLAGRIPKMDSRPHAGWLEAQQRALMSNTGGMKMFNFRKANLQPRKPGPGSHKRPSSLLSPAPVRVAAPRRQLEDVKKPWGW